MMEATDRAFDLVVLADLCPGRDVPMTARRVDRDTLPDLMKELAPEVTLAGVRLRFDDPRAFRPEALATGLPLTRDLIALRKRLKTGALPAGELKSEIEKLAASAPALGPVASALDAKPAPRTPAPAGPVTRPALATPGASTGDPLDAIFGMVETGATAAPAEVPARSASHGFLDRLIQSAAGLSKSSDAVPTATLRAIEQALDEAMSGSLRAALHDPVLGTAEAAWAGLRFLVRRIDFRSGIRLHVVPCSRGHLAHAFRETVAELHESVKEEGRALAAIADFEFGLDDLEDLASLAHAAATIRVPLVANAGAALLGFPSLAAALEGADDLSDTLADEAHIDWSGLRDEEPSRWVALAINRMLLRAPYGAEHDQVRDFAFEENPVGADAGYLWGGAAWAIGALIAASVERSGWAVEIAGSGEEFTIGDLPVRPLALRTGETVQCPLEALLSEKRVLELSRGGLIALTSRRNRDDAFAPTAPVVRRPGERGQKPDANDARRATLGFALFIAQIGVAIERLAADVDRSRTPEEIARTVARRLEFMGASGGDAPLDIQVEAEEETLAFTLRPQGGPLRGLPATRLELPLP